MKPRDISKLVISVTISELAGIVGAIFTTPSISSGWYAGLAKPALNPPSFVFGPVWTALYFLMGVALFLVWKNEWKISHPVLQKEGRKPWNRWSERLWFGDLQKMNIIAVFGVQLALNALWSVVFFGLRRPDMAFFVLVALWCSIVYVIVNFYRVSRAAAWLLAPYILWVSFAGYLNFSIWMLAMNPLANKTPQNLAIPETLPVTLYYYNPSLDQGPGGAECSRQGLAAVNRTIQKTETPIEDTIRLLLRGEITAKEKEGGLSTEYPLPGLILRSASLKNGELTLTFDDPQNKTGGGSCRVGILWFQIEATALQFPEVKNVRFLPEELFQP